MFLWSLEKIKFGFERSSQKTCSKSTGLMKEIIQITLLMILFV